MINTTYLRPLKAIDYKVLYDGYSLKEDLRVMTCEDAIILPLKNIEGINCGGVLDKNGEYIELSSLPDRIVRGYDVDSIDCCNQRVVFCGYFNPVWGHFLLDTISRLWYFVEYDTSKIDKYIFITKMEETQPISGNYREFFELLGIADKVEIINTPTRYSQIIIPELAFDLETHYSPKFYSIYKRVISQALKDNTHSRSFPPKIFFTRRGVKKACKYEIGMDRIDKFFEMNGFEILHPEKLSISELVQYLYNCEIVASYTGSVYHNILFGKPNQKIIVIERYANNNRFQPGIDAMMQLDISYIDANYVIYSVSAGLGPFLYDITPQLEKFALDNGYLLPQNKPSKSNLKQYIKCYRRLHRYQWEMPSWLVSSTHLMRESYAEAMQCYGQWLSGEKPLMASDYVNIWQILRKIKRILCR